MSSRAREGVLGELVRERVREDAPWYQASEAPKPSTV
jgi:hypothetical protein